MKHQDTAEPRVTADILAAMPQNKMLIFQTNGIADYQAQVRHAYWIKANKPRPDGCTYSITTSAAEGRIYIKATRQC